MSSTEEEAQVQAQLLLQDDAPAVHAPEDGAPATDAPSEHIDTAAEDAEDDDKENKKPVKEKKQRKPSEKKPKAPSHPPYFEMIKEAITALSEKGGSSPYAIAKYMEENHKPVLPANFRKILGLQLKNSVSRGKLIKIRASYKLSEAGKRASTTTTPKTRAARANAGAKPPKETATKRRKPKSRAVSKIDNPPPSLPTVPTLGATTRARRSKRAAPAAKPKQLKSIKSPAAKKAKKGSVTA